VSIREFARLDGCNEKLVRRAITEGRLPVTADKKLDPALAGSGWRKKNRQAAQVNPGADKRTAGLSASETLEPQGHGGALKRSRAPDPGEDVTDEFLNGFVENLLSGRFASLTEAERVKENGLALKHLLEARRKAGELVDVETAKNILFEAARSERDAWLNFPTRVGPMMAADLGLEPEPLIEALKAHVHQQLADLGEPELDFTADGETAA
jgi:hypothetical protein